jgi:hypothetical protein
MRRLGVLFAVTGLAAVTACGGGGSATTSPTRTAAATVAATVAATAGATPVPVPTDAEATIAAGATPAAVDLCTLLTTAEVGAALNETVSAGAAEDNSCVWIQADATGTSSLLIETDTVDDFDAIKALTGDTVTTTPVSGVGDDAYLKSLNPEVVTFYVRKGANVIQLQVVPSTLPVADQITALKALGAKAAARL